jgi:autotransporter-associated beta strand protein
LDFLDTSSSGYTATDDFNGGFLLNDLVLANNTANTDTIAATAGSFLNFDTAAPYITQSGSGTFVISAPISIDPHDSLTFNGTGTGSVIISGSLGGGAGTAFTQAGSNTLVLAGSNSFAGAFSVNSGILNVQNSGAISGVQGYVDSGATLQLQNNITESAALQLQGTGAAGQNGALVNVSGTNTITGNITFGGGSTTIASNSGTLIFSGASFGPDSNVLTLTGAGNGVFDENSLNIDGHAGFSLDGTGTWYFETPNPSFSGSLHLNAGTLDFVQGGLNGFFINPGGGVLQYAANTAHPDDLSNVIGYGSQGAPVAIDTNGNNVTFANGPNYNNTGGLIKYGAGALIFTGNYLYSGSTTIAGGTLQIGNGGSTGSLPGGTAFTDSSNLTVDLSSNITLYGSISGTGSLSQNGSGITTLSGSNSYSGTTTISAGTLQAGNNNAFGNNSDVTLANAANTALNITGYNNTIGALAGGGTLGGNVVLGSNTLTVGADNASSTYGGAISGSGGISKAGSGTLTLTGSSSFTGGGNVSAGILNVQNSAALGTGTSGTFAVFTGATLQLQGGITLPAYTVQVAGTGASTQDGAIVNLGGANTITGLVNVAGIGAGATTISSDSGTLTIAGGITTGGNNLTVSGAGTGIFANSGNVNFSGSNFVEKDGTGAWNFANGTTTFAGNLHLNAGTVSFVSGGLGQTTINANGGVLKYDTGNTQDVSGVAGDPIIQYGGGAPIGIDTNGNTVTFNGTLANNSNNTGLTKYGSGTLTLAATEVYPGTTLVTGGDLNVTGSILNSSILTVNGTGDLILAGADAVSSSAPISVSSGAALTVTSTQNLASIASSGIASFTAGTSIVGQGSGVGTGAGGGSTVGGISGAGSLTVNGTANLYSSTISQTFLTIGSASTVTIADSAAPGNTAATSVLTGISDTGTLDLNNNDLIVLNTTQYSTAKALIANAYDSGAWDKPGITSSSARANASVYGLGYAQASTIGSTSFDGVSFSDAVLVKYTLLGDTQLRGTVGIGDYDTVLSNYGTPQDWSGGNFHYSGVVGIGDYDDVLSNYGAHASGNVTVGPALTRSISPAASISPAGISPDLAKTDLKLEVNTTTGDVYILATASAAFTGYTISDPTAHLLGGSTSPDPDKLLSVSAGNGGNTNVYETSGTYVDWFKITETASQVAEGQQQNGFGTHSSRDDTINIPAGGTIDFGDIYNTAASQQDLTFDFAEAGTEPTNGPTYYGAEVDYITSSTPEPGSVSVLAIGAMGMVARRRRKA